MHLIHDVVNIMHLHNLSRHTDEIKSDAPLEIPGHELTLVVRWVLSDKLASCPYVAIQIFCVDSDDLLIRTSR